MKIIVDSWRKKVIGNMNDLFTKNFEKDLEEFDIKLNEKQLKQFIQYYELLVEWNSFINLTTIIQFEDVLKKHFLDSLSIIKALPNLHNSSNSLIDIGTGAGFPGIPIKIVFPNLKITLLDSINKRVKFLNDVICNLELENISVIHGRAEDCGRLEQLRESFDLCVSRAVANLSTLSEYCLPFVKKNGIFISYKSDKITEEYDKAKAAINILGGIYERQIDFKLPNSDIHRSLVIIRKEKVTPNKYPRKAGLPEKKPIF